MTKLTYSQQFNKLTQAYIRGEVNPYHPCHCFVGNLLNNTDEWRHGRETYGSVTEFLKHYILAQESISEESSGLYTVEDIVALEETFMNRVGYHHSEDELFHAFDATLDHLKKIHISKGENVDETPLFKKRKLQTA